MSSDSHPSDPDILDGWKSVADYLGKSVRTAQRWRQEFGMPVHRLGGREGENVYAYRSELDEWRRQASRLRGFAASDQDGSERPRTEPEAQGPNRIRKRGLGPFAWGAATVALLAVLGYAGWKAVSFGRRPETPAVVADRQPARWTVIGDWFHAYNAAGEELWRYHPGPNLSTSLYGGHTDAGRVPLPDLPVQVSAAIPMPSVIMSDIDGDGAGEVMLIAHASDPVEGSTLHCLDAKGRLRWTFKPRDPLGFGGEDYGPPARMPWVTLSSDPRGVTSVWVAAEHYTWFPTWIYRLDASGSVLARYGSNGRVNKLRFTSSGGRQLAWLGGVNNEKRTAAVAVFDLARFGGAAPAETSKYRCDGCPPGGPDHYFVFPRADVSTLMGGMPAVAEFAIHPSGEVVVSVQQHNVQLPGEAQPALALTNYRLDAGLRVQGAEYFSQYVAVHDYYTSLGRLDHPFDPQREATQLWPVLRWNGSGYDRIDGPER
jgi:hypothetical protein